MNETQHPRPPHVACSLNPDMRLATLTFVGGWPSFFAFQDALDTLASDPRVEPGFRILIDHSALTTPSSADTTRRAIELIASRHPVFRQIRWAGLAADNRSFSANGRVAAAIGDAQGLHLRVFTDRSEAMNWLLGASGL